MPGENCAFYGCGINRKHKRSLFKIPSIGVSDSEHTKTLKQNARQEWLRLDLRTREMTPDLKRIDANRLYNCERHFEKECILNSPTRKVLVTDSVPTENLPQRSHDVAKQERRVLAYKDNVEEPCSSASLSAVSTQAEPKITSIECLSTLVDELRIDPWQVDKSREGRH